MSSGEMGASTTEVVYVRLRGEGTTVYRPALASSAGMDVARLIAPDDYDPTDEDWEFKPGMLVRLASKPLGGQNVRVAVSLAE
jgi:hypothetical protein